MIKATALRPVNETKETIQFQNMKIVSVNEEKYPYIVEYLATRMFHIYKDIESVLRVLYRAHAKGENRFSASLEGKDEFQKQRIMSWLNDMKGVIAGFHYDESTNTVTGNLEMLPRARKFLTGQFMEIALTLETERILAELSARYGKPFQVQSNVIVATHDGIVQNEFDIVIAFGKLMYVIEIKTGASFRDYTKYYNVGRKYGIVPNRILLVDSWLEIDEADQAEYFAEYYVANLESFERKLVTMIIADMEGQNYA